MGNRPGIVPCAPEPVADQSVRAGTQSPTARGDGRLETAGTHREAVDPSLPCPTVAAGRCTVLVVPDAASGAAHPGVALPPGTYGVRQVTAPAGLTPADPVAPLQLCVAPAEGCVTSWTVVNASTYRTRTEIRLMSANGPVAGTAVTLTGPGVPAAPLVTDEDGRGTWRGSFRPGDRWFAVAGRPAPLLLTTAPERGDTSLPWVVEMTLQSVEPSRAGAERPEQHAAPVRRARDRDRDPLRGAGAHRIRGGAQPPAPARLSPGLLVTVSRPSARDRGRRR